jgi:hypothetical protein
VQHGLRFRLATIASDVPAATVLAALRKGQLRPLDADTSGSPLALPTEAEVLSCTHIVGQCGSDTFKQALQTLPDVLIAGRACDTAIFSALPEMLGYPRAMLAELSLDSFTLESMNPALHATPASVAAHALYEQSDPFEVQEPEGTLRLDSASYTALDAHRTQVSGAAFVPAAKPTLKIEGAARVGARAVLLAGVADPTLLQQLPRALAEVQSRVRALLPGDWSLHAHVYGQGAVRPLPAAQHSQHEAGLVVEFIAPDAATARTAAGVFKQNLLHYGFAGRVSTAGNLAFAFTPSEIDAGDAYRFVIYHLLHDVPLADLFDIQTRDMGDVAA